MDFLAGKVSDHATKKENCDTMKQVCSSRFELLFGNCYD